MSTNLMKLYVSPDYIGEPDLDGKERIMQIAGCEIVRGLKGGPTAKPKDAVVLSLTGAKKRLILNKTNAKAIAKKYGSRDDGWIGKWIRLVPEKCDAYGEKNVPCVRVYPCAAPSKPEPMPEPAPAPTEPATPTAT